VLHALIEGPALGAQPGDHRVRVADDAPVFAARGLRERPLHAHLGDAPLPAQPLGEAPPEVERAAQRRPIQREQRRFVLGQALDQLLDAPEERQAHRLANDDADRDRSALRQRQTHAVGQSLLERGERLAHAEHAPRALGEADQQRHRLVRVARLRVVVAEHARDLVELPLVQRLERARHAAVQKLATCRQKALVDRLADAIVAEVQLLVIGAQEARRDQLFDHRDPLALVQIRALQ
jgi:hypothetical protein